MNESSETADNRRQTWIRGLFILLFIALYHVAEVVGAVVVLFQFVHVLITGKPNAQALGLGEGLARYYKELVQYVTFNTDEKPFPFGEWPGSGGGEATALDI